MIYFAKWQKNFLKFKKNPPPTYAGSWTPNLWLIGPELYR